MSGCGRKICQAHVRGAVPHPSRGGWDLLIPRHCGGAAGRQCGSQCFPHEPCAWSAGCRPAWGLPPSICCSWTSAARAGLRRQVRGWPSLLSCTCCTSGKYQQLADVNWDYLVGGPGSGPKSCIFFFLLPPLLPISLHAAQLWQLFWSTVLPASRQQGEGWHSWAGNVPSKVAEAQPPPLGGLLGAGLAPR